jgi:hypothetical protein
MNRMHVAIHEEWLTVMVPLLGLLGLIGWPLFWMSWASRRLKQRFREQVAAQFTRPIEEDGRQS